MKRTFRVSGTLVRTDETRIDEDAFQSEIRDVFRSIMTELLDLSGKTDGVSDPGLSGSIAEHTIDIRLTVEGLDPMDAALLAFATIRSAVHAAGVGTPEWSIDAIRLEEVIDDELTTAASS